MPAVEVFDIDQIPARMQDFYEAVNDYFDVEARQQSQDFYWDRYIPSISAVDDFVRLKSDAIWWSVQPDFTWAPLRIEDTFKKGLRAGHAWAQAELANG